MDARICRALALAACFVSLGASYRTTNFLVSAPTPELSREIGDAAESYRRDLALEWLGQELPRWQDPCPITVHAGSHLGAGGATSFMFDGRRPFGWRMTIQGSKERILDSVLPHEITHTIFATHFGRPLPRWADEGACTTVEHDSEKNKQKQLLIEFLTTGRGIAFNKMFAMTEYPPDVLPLYSQGYSLARYLIAQGGKQKFVAYVGEGMRSSDWNQATAAHYGFQDLSDLQIRWLDWVRNGSRPLQPATTAVASSDTRGADPAVADTALAASASSPGRPNREARVVAAAAAAGTPARLASTTATAGWYSRIRDEARTNPVTPAAGPGGRAAAPDSAQSLSRQQPVGRPQQRVLEWTNDGPPRPRPQAYLVPRGSILR